MFDSCFTCKPDDCVELLSRRQSIAREPHKCGECGCTIEPGQRYEADSTVFEGEEVVYKTCNTCRNIRDGLFTGGWYYGGIWETIHEQYCGYSSSDDDEDFCLCPTKEKP